MNESIEQHYRELLQKHGSGHESAQYSSRETQEKRYEILIQIADLEGSKVLDFGCGTGHLFTYLKNKGITVDYTGVDIVNDFFEIAENQNPDGRFGHLEQFISESFDYVFISGVFNNKRESNIQFYQESLQSLYSQSKKGLAFNMMSSYVDYKDENLFYEAPENVFSFVKQNLSPFVILRHDYEIKPGIIPFEFAVFVYRKAP